MIYVFWYLLYGLCLYALRTSVRIVYLPFQSNISLKSLITDLWIIYVYKHNKNLLFVRFVW